MAEINACFSSFDAILGRHSVEKIKTIGDSYMAAGGLPVPDESAVKNVVRFALEMQAFIIAPNVKLTSAGLPSFEMRAGVHTRPVVAGIVGAKKLQYDVWDDSINTACRVKSSGEVGKVNISDTTCRLLKDDSELIFKSRGKMTAKGK